MATIESKVLFVTTSPRTPHKMVPEIELLHTHFSGKKWNLQTQQDFMKLLREENFFNGSGTNDPAFSARDRINRAPKSLGFVVLSPKIKLTPAGLALVNEKRKDEIFLRQLLKFQIPSPYHKPSSKSAKFWVKPYLELFRLIRHFGSLQFDEVMIFGLQLINYCEFENIVSKIDRFRIDKANNKGNYKVFRYEYFSKELVNIYNFEINSGKIKIREAAETSIKKFIRTKANNMRDYTDACFRYLRVTGLVNISYIGKSISIIPEKIEEVDYFLGHTKRDPELYDSSNHYIDYLGSMEIPVLLTDNKELLKDKIKSHFPEINLSEDINLVDLKNTVADELHKRKENLISSQINNIKNYKFFDEIKLIFSQILEGSLYDAPLMFEWNTWRAMTMLDGGNIKANLKFDDFGMPLSTAQGNMADIICDYGDFYLTVEVTLQSGQRQYEAESEPITRHLAKLKKEVGKPTYCLFIAPKINEACIAHFYALHKMNISYYGGTSTIVPIPLNIFLKMLEDSYKKSYVPEPGHVQRLFEYSNKLANITNNETEWYEKITHTALNWLD